MLRKANIDVAEQTKQKIADGISRGLFNANVKFNDDRQPYNNEQGLANLNCIF